MSNFCKVYQSYQTWWHETSYLRNGETSNETFEECVNSMSLYDFMELMNNWDIE
jgi:hypothetical protein